VREASLEKRILHHIAPHLAQPLPFLFPTYAGTPWPLWQLRLGVKLYDFLCNGKNFGKSEAFSRAELLAKMPQLSSEGLTGGVRYFDALTNDARLVLDTLRSAVENGAIICNYLKFKTADREPGNWLCELEDSESGRKWSVRARAIVNASGPWAELVPRSQVKLRLTKGIHVVIERTRLPISEAIAITQGKRLLFILPWGERLIVGTTDTDYSGTIDDVRAGSEDIDYLLRTVNKFFPRLTLSRAHVLSAWAGLRPLIADPNGSPSEIPRSHQLRNPEPGWWDLAGGKLTTYRLMAEQTIDAIVRSLKETAGCKAGPCRTSEQPLLSREQTQGVSGILPAEVKREVVEHYCSNEWALHLDDVMLRRTGWQHYLPNAPGTAEQVADWMRELLGWSSEIRAAELRRYRQSVY
jgi:glycerol-3-phosphate dehydrogenase